MKATECNFAKQNDSKTSSNEKAAQPRCRTKCMCRKETRGTGGFCLTVSLQTRSWEEGGRARVQLVFSLLSHLQTAALKLAVTMGWWEM